MVNSTWRIGDFYFKSAEEPYRLDVKHKTRVSDKVGETFLPYTVLWRTGTMPTSIVMQGLLADFTIGTNGDWGLEKLG